MKIEIDKYLKDLFPLNRSITGKPNRRSLKILKNIIPLKIKSIKSGTKVYDWIIPPEWNAKDAYIKDSNGKKIISLKNNNLHLMSYSIPCNKKMNWNSLKNKLITHIKLPDAIPYRTSYYDPNWAFCVNQKQYNELKNSNGPFSVKIDTEFDKNGSLVYGEYLIQGESKKEILISTYICHPSMANDCLSGMILTALLARKMSNLKLKWSYRFVFVPETIGMIAYCKINEKKMKDIDTALVVTTVGGRGKIGFKESWDKNHKINSTIETVLKERKVNFIKYPFDIRGSDERQLSSQAFRINSATISKDKYFEYKFYHSSKDNLDYVKSINILKTLDIYLHTIRKIEKWKIYKTIMPNCEYMLSKKDLYNKIGGSFLEKHKSRQDILLWILFLSDGILNTQQISEKIKVNEAKIIELSNYLCKKDLLIKI